MAMLVTLSGGCVANALNGAIVNGKLAALVRPPSVAVNVYLPVLSTVRPLKVATPALATSFVVPLRIAPFAAVSAKVTADASVVTTFPFASSILTLTPNGTPFPEFAGGFAMKASFVGAGVANAEKE